MTNYEPGVAGVTPMEQGELRDWIERELLSLAELLNDGMESHRNVVLHAEPDRPRNGMIVYADGTNWNPGSGEGFYGYEGGAWVKL